MGGGTELRREGTYVYLWLIHVDVRQRPIQYCKAIVLQLKKKKKKITKELQFSYALSPRPCPTLKFSWTFLSSPRGCFLLPSGVCQFSLPAPG